MESVIIFIAIVGLGVLTFWGLIRYDKWFQAKTRDQHAERALREEMEWQRSQKKAADKILREQGSTP